MRGVLAKYIRISNEDCDKAQKLKDESSSLSNQRLLIRDFIREHDELSDFVVIEYSDDGYTGTNFERPQFQQMLTAAKRGEVQCIIVKDFSRLGRNFLEVSEYIDRVFPSLGVRLISIGDSYDSNDYSGTTAGMSVAFRNLIYECYSKDLSVKVRTAMMTRMEKAHYVTAPVYGYRKAENDKHQLIPNPETAPIVKEIFARVLAGASTTEVAKELNRRGIPTPQQYKNHRPRRDCKGLEPQWTRQSVLQILQNRKYTGTMINHIKESRYLRDTAQRKTKETEWYVRENAHEPLISKEDFERVNRCLRHPVRYVRKERETLDTVYCCGYCGYKLHKTVGADPLFFCETPHYQENAPCKGMRWRKSELEAVLLPSYRTQLLLLDDLALTMDKNPEDAVAECAKDMERLEERMTSCEKEKIALYEAYRDGELDRDAYRQKKQLINDRRLGLENDYDKTAKRYAECRADCETADSMKDRIREELAAGELRDELLLQQMYRSLDRVVVGHNEIEIHWQFEDIFKHFKAVSLPEKTAKSVSYR